MITLIEAKDIKDLWGKLEEINERTKKHTIDIKALEKQMKASVNLPKEL